MILNKIEIQRINKMTSDLYELADNIRKGHVELNRAREQNITARNIQNQYKILFANEILAQTAEKQPKRLREAV